VLDRLLKEYGGQVRLIFKDFPLSSHALARPAHEAARCAGQSGRYWEYHDRLFQAQPRFAREDLIRYATELGLSREAFVRCLDRGESGGLVERDVREGREAGVSGTPTFFINGLPLRGAAPYEAFKQLIDEALAETTKK
jgi:protein-disulfide isomerase